LRRTTPFPAVRSGTIDDARDEPRFVFLIGNGRSGSTLVHELLGRHPAVGFVSNVEDRLPFLPASASRLNNALYARVPPALTRKGRVRYAPSEGYRVLARQVSPMLETSIRDLYESDAMPWAARRFRAFFVDRARAQSKPVFVHKFTGWPRTGFIRAIFPDARFIHIVRDGRGVVASAVQLSWWQGYKGPHHLHAGPLKPEYQAEWDASGRSFPLLSALIWKTNMDAIAAARRLVPPEQWIDMRFEEIVSDPVAQFKAMLGFMGLEPSHRFDEAVARTHFEASRKDSWQRELDARSTALVEASMEDHLRFWGYA
jgi:hypothetical protein